METRSVLLLLSMCHATMALPGGTLTQSPNAFQRAAAPAPDKEIIKRGEAVFNKYCPICHLGRPDKTRPLVGKNLRGILKNVKPDRATAVREAIEKGGDTMPGFQFNLTPAQIDDLMGYLKTYN